MSNIRIYNARILTMADGMHVINAEIWIRGNRIAYVGDGKNVQAGGATAPGRTADTEIRESIVWDREINAQGNLVLPGFKNAHTHSGMTFLRSYADDMPLGDWLNKQIFPMEARLTPEMIYHLSKLAILEYLSGGITANFDMYLTPDTIAQASLDCGFRTVMTGGFNNFSQSLAELEHWYKVYNKPDSLVSFILGFHAEYTNSRENLEGIADLAGRYKAPVFTHNSETASEVRACRERYGMTPTAFLDSLGVFAYGGGGYHCVYVTSEDMDIMRQRDLAVVTNPASNAKLASGIAPIAQFLEKGITVAIGTDGPASNNCLDMFREMFLVTGLAKLREHDASAVDASQVLTMATVNGAKVMRLTDCDVLAPGKLADLVMIDLHQPNMQPLNHIPQNLVYSGSKANVRLTMVNGQILYENGEYFIGQDPEEIYAKANEIIAGMQG